MPAGCPGLSLAISAQFTLEMCVAATKCKTLNLSILGRSKSFKVINVNTIKSLSLMLVSSIHVSVPISNCFYAKRVNSGKTTTF